MLPSEFLDAFGGIQPLTVQVQTGGIALVPPDDERYLIAFGGRLPLGAYDVYPDLDRGNSFGGFSVNDGDPLLIFTHALHGSLVNIGWRLTFIDILAPVQINYFVGRMPVNRSPRRRS
jgi:hypothetical protein